MDILFEDFFNLVVHANIYIFYGCYDISILKLMIKDHKILILHISYV